MVIMLILAAITIVLGAFGLIFLFTRYLEKPIREIEKKFRSLVSKNLRPYAFHSDSGYKYEGTFEAYLSDKQSFYVKVESTGGCPRVYVGSLKISIEEIECINNKLTSLERSILSEAFGGESLDNTEGSSVFNGYSKRAIKLLNHLLHKIEESKYKVISQKSKWYTTWESLQNIKGSLQTKNKIYIWFRMAN